MVVETRLICLIQMVQSAMSCLFRLRHDAMNWLFNMRENSNERPNSDQARWQRVAKLGFLDARFAHLVAPL